MEASIVIPVYNAGLYLRQSLDSVFKAADHLIEIICVDDFSEDNSVEILQEYQIIFPNLKIFKNKYNIGVTRTLIKAISNSTYDLIIRHDADDLMSPNRISSIRSHLSETKNTFFFGCCLTQIFADSHKIFSTLAPPLSLEEFRLAMCNFTSPCAHGSIFFSRSLYIRVGGYNPKYSVAQDFALYISFLECKNIAYVPIYSDQPLYFHRISSSSVTARSWRRKIFLKYQMFGLYKKAKISPNPHKDYLLFFFKSFVNLILYSVFSEKNLIIYRSRISALSRFPSPYTRVLCRIYYYISFTLKSIFHK